MDVFFFKQKTAYEMRISDWSSDVCSSDLTLVAAVDSTSNHLRLFSMQGADLVEVGARAIPLGFAAEGVCLFRNPLDSALYAFVVGDGGEVDQHILYATADGKLDARQVRRISVPSPLKQCVAGSEEHT